jgi:hypothetical protein
MSKQNTEDTENKGDDAEFGFVFAFRRKKAPQRRDIAAHREAAGRSSRNAAAVFLGWSQLPNSKPWEEVLCTTRDFFRNEPTNMLKINDNSRNEPKIFE